MKIRTSFVANSSSASFVLTIRADRGDFFRRFDLTLIDFIEEHIKKVVPSLEKFVKEYDRDKIGKDIRTWYNQELYDRDKDILEKLTEINKQIQDGRYHDDPCTPEWFKIALELCGVRLEWGEAIELSAGVSMFNTMLDCPSVLPAIFADCQSEYHHYSHMEEEKMVATFKVEDERE